MISFPPVFVSVSMFLSVYFLIDNKMVIFIFVIGG